MRLALPRVVVVGLVVLVVTAAVLALLAFVVHGPVTKGALARSIAHQAGGHVGPCWRQRNSGPGRWACTVMSDDTVGSATYDIQVRPGSSCWDAALALTYGSETEPATWPARSSGCVHRLELPRPA